MVFTRKSKGYVKENVVFDFINSEDLRSVEELEKGYKKAGGETVKNAFPSVKKIKISQEAQKIAGFSKTTPKQNEGKVLILVARDKAKGNKVIAWEEIYFAKTRPVIMTNYVHPQYRRAGIASSFHGISKIIAAEAGYSGIEHGIPVNQAAKKALRKGGFIGSANQKEEKRVKIFKRGTR